MLFSDVDKAVSLIRELKRLADDRNAINDNPDAEVRVILEWPRENQNPEKYAIVGITLSQLFDLAMNRKREVLTQLADLGVYPDLQALEAPAKDQV